MGVNAKIASCVVVNVKMPTLFGHFNIYEREKNDA